MRNHSIICASVVLFQLVAWHPPAAAAEKAPVVAFLGVEDKGFVFQDKQLEGFEQMIEGLLAADGFKVVPAEKVRDYLGDRDCRRARCWNVMGRDLGSDKGLRIRVVRSGTTCTLVESLFDTTGRLTIEARTHETSCRQKDVLASWRKTLPRLLFEETGWKGAEQQGGELPKRLSKEQIDHVFYKYEGELQRCLEKQKQRDSSVAGKMRISFSIKPSGRVGKIRILSEEHREAFVAECVGFVLKSMHFPLYRGETMPPLTREFQLGQ